MPVHGLVNVFTSVITNESSSLPRPSSQEDHGESDVCVPGSSRGVRLPAQWVRFKVSSALEALYLKVIIKQNRKSAIKRAVHSKIQMVIILVTLYFNRPL